MKLFFWGQFTEKEYAMPFCSAWRRQAGSVEHFAYRAVASELGREKALLGGFEKIKKFKPDFVVNWQGNSFEEKDSLRLRECCEEVGAKFVFISLDDPFVLLHNTRKPYKHAHIAITCCKESIEFYNNIGIQAIFAPPPCSIEHHIVGQTSHPRVNGVFYFFTNPYIEDIFVKHGALNRFDSIRELLIKNIPVGLASFDALRKNTYLSEGEWAKIDWKGFVPYDDFNQFKNWTLHFNSSVVGQEYTYLNQRVFEILGIGGVQTLDASPQLLVAFDKLCAEAGVAKEDTPFIFYTTRQEFASRSEEFINSPEVQKRKQDAAMRIRWIWTFDHLVRRLAFNEKTFFDRL